MKAINELQKEADNLRNNGKTTEAISLYKKIFKTADNTKNWKVAGHAIQMIGVCYKIDNETKSSLNWLKKASKYYEDHDLNDEVGDCLRDIAITYEYKNQLIKAEALLKRALGLFTDRKDSSFGITLAKLGLVQTRRKFYPEARKNLSESIKILEKTDNWFFLGTAKWHLAGLSVAEKDYNKAIKELLEVIELFKKHPEQPHLRRFGQFYGLISYCYATTGDTENAKRYFKDSMNIIQNGDFTPEAQMVILKDIIAEKTLEILKKSR